MVVHRLIDRTSSRELIRKLLLMLLLWQHHVDEPIHEYVDWYYFRTPRLLETFLFHLL
jgi:hypothetical protein